MNQGGVFAGQKLFRRHRQAGDDQEYKSAHYLFGVSLQPVFAVGRIIHELIR
jgi:hypothetical protein